MYGFSAFRRSVKLIIFAYVLRGIPFSSIIFLVDFLKKPIFNFREMCRRKIFNNFYENVYNITYHHIYRCPVYVKKLLEFEKIHFTPKSTHHLQEKDA